MVQKPFLAEIEFILRVGDFGFSLRRPNDWEELL